MLKVRNTLILVARSVGNWAIEHPEASASLVKCVVIALDVAFTKPEPAPEGQED